MLGWGGQINYLLQMNVSELFSRPFLLFGSSPTTKVGLDPNNSQSIVMNSNVGV